jgi:hypothetical protein
MRVGHNPARFVERVAQPAEITVAVVNCIPFLSGYYEQCLDVLKTVVESLHATRDPEHPYDVMVFDNHSCSEVMMTQNCWMPYEPAMIKPWRNFFKRTAGPLPLSLSGTRAQRMMRKTFSRKHWWCSGKTFAAGHSNIRQN